MPIAIRDQHLEEKINEERERRGDATLAKTASDIIRERLMQLASDRQQRNQERPATIPAS